MVSVNEIVVYRDHCGFNVYFCFCLLPDYFVFDTMVATVWSHPFPMKTHGYSLPSLMDYVSKTFI